MNAKQFLNTAILEGMAWLARRYRLVAQGGRAFLDALFPQFLRIPIPRFWRRGVTLKGIGLGYLFVFVLLFVVQAIWAASNGMLMPDELESTKTFVEDRANMINYAVLCEAYCIVGFLFLVQTYTVRTRLRRDGIPIEAARSRSALRGGYLAALAIVLLATTGSAGYALAIHNYAVRYWFMAAGPPDVTLGAAGYYYLFVNFLLLLFVIWAGFAHFGLFHVARDLSAYLRSVTTSSDAAELEAWADDETPKRRLASFANYVVTSKLMVFIIMLNMLTWKMNEVNVGAMYGLSVVITAVFGVWIFSLPRYAVQRHIFHIRRAQGKSAYPDVRGPWVLGLSSFLDILLFSFIVNYLLGDAVGRLFEALFS